MFRYLWNSDDIQKLTKCIKKEITPAKIAKLSHFKGVSQGSIKLKYDILKQKQKFEAHKVIPNDKSKIQYLIK
jgi:hypothetical protein